MVHIGTHAENAIEAITLNDLTRKGRIKMTAKKKISLAMGLLLASTALQAEEVVNRGIDVSVVTGGVAVPTGTTLNGAERNVMFGDRSY